MKETTEREYVVIFRTDKNYGETVAFMPEEPWATRGRDTVVSFVNQGQHGPASWDYYSKDTKPATDYADLKAELERIGYRLKVVSKWTRRYDTRRYEKQATWNK